MAARTFMLLAAIYLSYIALGLPDGALGLAWPIIREEMGMPLEALGILSLVSGTFYVLVSSQNSRISKYISTDKMNLLGLLLFVTAFFVYSIAPNFMVLALITIFVGCGSGLIDISLNDYMSKHFSSRYMNWMHCFWGMGAAIGPIIMARMIMLGSWRGGYVTIASIQAVVAVFVIISMAKGVWRLGEKQNRQNAKDARQKVKEGRYLSAGRYGFLQMLAFFALVGIEGSVALWVSSILIESRGLSIEAAGVFPAVYFICIMAGRFIFGFAAARLGNMAIMRIGIFIAAVGILILVFSNSVLGMALTGLGIAPIFPCLMHESSIRFAPNMLSKLVGYQIAAAGVGSATFALLMGQILARISLEALFPILLGLAAIIAVINEALEWKLRRA